MFYQILADIPELTRPQCAYREALHALKDLKSLSSGEMALVQTEGGAARWPMHNPNILFHFLNELKKTVAIGRRLQNTLLLTKLKGIQTVQL